MVNPRAIERLLPEAEYRDSSTYARLIETWFDSRTIPSESALDTAEDDVLADDAAAAAQESADLVTIAEAETNAAAIPNWATWDESEVTAWIAGKFDQTTIDNITNLAEAQVVLGDMATAMRAMARLIIALRDAQWPNLGG